MEQTVRIAVLAVIVAVCCLTLRRRAEELAVPLSLLGVVAVLLCALRFLEPVMDVIRRLEKLAGMDHAVIAPMLKTVGIGFLTQISASVCEDAGEKTLSGSVGAAGGVMALYSALPLLSAVIDTLEELLL